MYKSIHDISPVTSNGAEVDERRLTHQWAGLWRILILSTFENTVFPYYRYIRVLSLRDLAALLDDSIFRDQISREFFKGELAGFAVDPRGRVNLRSRGHGYNIPATVERIGDRLTEQTTMIEELDCSEINHESLSRWIPRLKRLQQLRLWNGTALIGAGSLLKAHCPDFTILKFFMWRDEDADTQFSTFLTDLSPKPIKSVEIFGSSRSSSSVITALSSFSGSLVELKFGAIEDELLTSLPKLGPCPLLRTLHLESRIAESSLSAPTKTSIAAWLTTCPALTDVRFINDNTALIPALFTPLLLDPAIHLQNLELTRYDSSASGARAFHSALSSQSGSLRSLILKADGESCDCDHLVSNLCRLTGLKDLHLFHISDFFTDAHIKTLANSMPDLEELVVSGWNISDDIFPSLSTLRSLRRLDLNAFSSFSFDAVLEYISTLGPGNNGLALSISMAEPAAALSEDEQAVAREMLAEKVGGRFDYALARGRNSFLDCGAGAGVVSPAMRVMLLL